MSRCLVSVSVFMVVLLAIGVSIAPAQQQTRNPLKEVGGSSHWTMDVGDHLGGRLSRFGKEGREGNRV